MMNVISEQGTYWIANGFVWGWLLLPFFPLAELLKQDVASREKINHKEKMYGYFTIATGIVVLWIITIPFWNSFFEEILIFNKLPAIDPKIKLVPIVNPTGKSIVSLNIRFIFVLFVLF